jgi:hypothetical protein
MPVSCARLCQCKFVCICQVCKTIGTYVGITCMHPRMHATLHVSCARIVIRHARTYLCIVYMNMDNIQQTRTCSTRSVNSLSSRLFSTKAASAGGISVPQHLGGNIARSPIAVMRSLRRHGMHEACLSMHPSSATRLISKHA